MVKKFKKIDYGTGDDIYTGVSTFGRVVADVRAVVGTIFGLLLIILGIYLIIKKSHRTKTIQGIITNSDCQEIIKDNSIYFNCNLTVNYIINGVLQTKTFTLSDSSVKYIISNKITLWYDPNNISNIELASDNLHSLGIGILIFGIFIIVFSILWAYLANKYKPVAAAEGIFDGINLISGR